MKTDQRSLIYPGYGKYNSPISVLEEFCSWIEIDANPGEYMLLRRTYHTSGSSPLRRLALFNEDCLKMKENAQSCVGVDSTVKLSSTLEEVLSDPLTQYYNSRYEVNRF
jgi:hypothetical protein